MRILCRIIGGSHTIKSYSKLTPSVTNGLLDVYMYSGYNWAMIISFVDKETEKIYRQVFSKKLPHDIQHVALRKLIMLNNAKTLQDLRVPPANRFEKLSGDRDGQYSIRINDQYRICFCFEDGEASRVEIVDYH